MAILTYSGLRSYGLRAINESVKLANARKSPYSRDVFLSYSSKDESHLTAVITFLEEHGATVYVDRGDDRLPEPPNPKTAAILKTEIQACPRFIALVSPNSKSSRWIPWELGLADGTKKYEHVATLPMAETSTGQYWVSQEYLGIYPRIEQVQAQGDTKPEWRVVDPRDNASWKLGSWLKRT